MILFTQILTGCLILLIGFMSFKWDKPDIKIKTVVIVSLFVALSLVLSLFSWMIPLFGFPSRSEERRVG